MRKAWFNTFQRIRNLVKDVHRKVEKYLCENYDVGFVPEFSSGSMAHKKRCYRRIWSKITRAILAWSHCSFRMLQRSKTAEAEMAVITVTEEYTSKSCGSCGNVHQTGSAKVISCPSCGFTPGRGVNGARSILLKSMHEHGLQVSATSNGDQAVALGPNPSR